MVSMCHTMLSKCPPPLQASLSFLASCASGIPGWGRSLRCHVTVWDLVSTLVVTFNHGPKPESKEPQRAPSRRSPKACQGTLPHSWRPVQLQIPPSCCSAGGVLTELCAGRSTIARGCKRSPVSLHSLGCLSCDLLLSQKQHPERQKHLRPLTRDPLQPPCVHGGQDLLRTRTIANGGPRCP